MKIALPWPDKLLWPNGSRGHHFAVSRAKKSAKHSASWAAIEVRQRDGLPDFGEGEIGVRLYVYAKPKGPLPDKDNCVAAVKVQLDSIAHECGVNDRRFSAPEVIFCEPRVGKIEVELSPLSPATGGVTGFIGAFRSAKECGPETGACNTSPALNTSLDRRPNV